MLDQYWLLIQKILQVRQTLLSELTSDGKIYLFCGFDELHGYKTWDILEAMQGDPTRTDVMIWITSYAGLYHKPDVRLFDLFAQGKRLSPR